jgi:hypothetical protein
MQTVPVRHPQALYSCIHLNMDRRMASVSAERALSQSYRRMGCSHHTGFVPRTSDLGRASRPEMASTVSKKRQNLLATLVYEKIGSGMLPRSTGTTALSL